MSNALPEYGERTITVSDNRYISPMKTYRIDFTNKRILGTINKEDTIMQFIQKALSTDKYYYSIYDWYYGNELKSLVGKPLDYIMAEIPRIVEEALLTDDRIKEVKDFKFKRESYDVLSVMFTVVSIYSEQQVVTEVLV